MCADGLSLAETVKNQLRNQFTEELKVFKIRQEREKAEEEARKAKEEMWKMEAERRRLEAESEAAQREIEEMNEESRRQQAEAERQELIRIYGDPDKILQEATAPPSRPPPPSTVPSSAPNIAPPPYTPRQEPLQSPYQPVNNNVPIVPPRHNKPGKKGGASFRWSFGPLSTCGSNEATTIITTHPSLFNWIPAHFLITFHDKDFKNVQNIVLTPHSDSILKINSRNFHFINRPSHFLFF